MRGVIQIAHGMGEHNGRYIGAIKALVSAGLTVYGNDHRDTVELRRLPRISETDEVQARKPAWIVTVLEREEDHD